MELIENESDLLDNIFTLNSYQLGTKEYEFYLDLVKRGVCFVVVKNEARYKFYPSRFLGYKKNTYDNHMNNDLKNGRETNQIITTILGHKLSEDINLEIEYRKYCEKLGFSPKEKGAFGVSRKFWKVIEI